QSFDRESAAGDFQLHAGQAAKDLSFSTLPLALDELQKEDAHAVARCSDYQTNRRRCLALTVAGVDDCQAMSPAALYSTMSDRGRVVGPTGTVQVGIHRRTTSTPGRLQAAARTLRGAGCVRAPRPHRPGAARID